MEGQFGIYVLAVCLDPHSGISAVFLGSGPWSILHFYIVGKITSWHLWNYSDIVRHDHLASLLRLHIGKISVITELSYGFLNPPTVLEFMTSWNREFHQLKTRQVKKYFFLLLPFHDQECWIGQIQVIPVIFKNVIFLFYSEEFKMLLRSSLPQLVLGWNLVDMLTVLQNKIV